MAPDGQRRDWAEARQPHVAEKHLVDTVVVPLGGPQVLQDGHRHRRTLPSLLTIPADVGRARPSLAHIRLRVCMHKMGVTVQPAFLNQRQSSRIQRIVEVAAQKNIHLRIISGQKSQQRGSILPPPQRHREANENGLKDVRRKRHTEPPQDRIHGSIVIDSNAPSPSSGNADGMPQSEDIVGQLVSAAAEAATTGTPPKQGVGYQAAWEHCRCSHAGRGLLRHDDAVSSIGFRRTRESPRR